MRTHPFSILAALIGTARYKFGQFLLNVLARHRASLPARARFELGWQFIRKFQWLFRGRDLSGNRYSSDWKNYAFMRLLAILNNGTDRFVPSIQVYNEGALLQAIEDQVGIVVVTLHSRVHTVLSRVFEERGISHSVIANSLAVQVFSELLGLRGKVDLVRLGDSSLLVARKKLRAGRLIWTCADFTVREPGTLYHDIYVADGLFEFAKNCGARLVYAVSNVSEDGIVEVFLSRPSIDEERASPFALANDFVDFCRTASTAPADWKIGPWTLRERSQTKQFDNFCVHRFPKNMRHRMHD